MEKYPGTHRTFCVRAYYRNGDSIVASQRLYRAKYRTQHAPSDDSIRKWIRMFENTGATVKIQYWLLSFSPRRRNDSRSGRVSSSKSVFIHPKARPIIKEQKITLAFDFKERFAFKSL
ncbi:unnamed protein product [Euphydryas editha]|uniref:DUF4817 domain-containing protein n=1 Tax=Euphydryas editha TaxID=104508 RepID=A0AAU9VB18_EUPED|nr:unnamed protein product [Euphydryas editha]